MGVQQSSAAQPAKKSVAEGLVKLCGYLVAGVAVGAAFSYIPETPVVVQAFIGAGVALFFGLTWLHAALERKFEVLEEKLAAKIEEAEDKTTSALWDLKPDESRFI